MTKPQSYNMYISREWVILEECLGWEPLECPNSGWHRAVPKYKVYKKDRSHRCQIHIAIFPSKLKTGRFE